MNFKCQGRLRITLPGNKQRIAMLPRGMVVYYRINAGARAVCVRARACVRVCVCVSVCVCVYLYERVRLCACVRVHARACSCVRASVGWKPDTMSNNLYSSF